ncbi:hypothetical protein AAFF_G00106050 [Aldrovandia affinis]|uniref:Uncharacterized protein n=1 Tax=Aldrovandia affinis TaxID=143900 RepID=A0AAD7WXX2_9TELE|nr:hypothetical protein AAFF_G00106050 [Aldrovandia affinis]
MLQYCGPQKEVPRETAGGLSGSKVLPCLLQPQPFSAALICIHSLWICVSNNVEGNPRTHLGQRLWPAAVSLVPGSEGRF